MEKRREERWKERRGRSGVQGQEKSSAEKSRANKRRVQTGQVYSIKREVRSVKRIGDVEAEEWRYRFSSMLEVPKEERAGERRVGHVKLKMNSLDVA
eukprot:768580-Hanusia_phi.AAC.4